MSTAFLFNNKMMKYGTHVMGISSSPTPPTPPIPANTVRVRTNDGNVPNNRKYDTATLVTGTTDVYDVYRSGTSWSSEFRGCTNIVEVLGANATGITSMESMLEGCTSLTTVSLFDTSNVRNMSYMLQNCTSLTAVPLFNTSSATEVIYMFRNCTNVESGALALYNQLSTQGISSYNHSGTFMNCGSNTTTGAAELAQIPSDWK